MEIIALYIHVYTLVLLYEIFTCEKNRRYRWIIIILVGVAKYVIESSTHVKFLIPFILCTLLILYSICIHRENSYLENLKYALISYGLDYIISIALGSICGSIIGLTKIRSETGGYFIICISRIFVVFMLMKGKAIVVKIRKGWISYIGVISAIVLLIIEQLLLVYYTAQHKDNSYVYIAVACTYLAFLFTILWLLDHYKMAKIQKMYADDNQQMSQKLHRSKEILPMIANYVSTMDGTPDEGMRKKLEEVCHDYGKELGGMEMCAEFIETTGIDLVDLLLRTKIIECGEQDIELNVFVSTQIAEDMKRMDISDGEITRLMGDLLRNAINAVSKLQNKMILLLIARDENDCVLIRIYDSGIPFPPYVLERFGERGNTTWGTGNGIADMMETLRRVHASIEINMDMDAGDVFTKGIFICFDGEDNVNITQRKEYPGDAEGRVCF